MNDARQQYEFECKRCGELGTVGFQPRNPDELLCRECFDETGGKTYDLSNVTKAPRRKHDTRVSFNITCSECGLDDELDYVPKGVPMSEVLCRSCMAERAGEDSRWALVQQQKRDEQKKKQMFRFICMTCGVESDLPFKPHPDRTYDCYDCFLEKQREEEAPEPRAPRHDLGDNVFIRKKK